VDSSADLLEEELARTESAEVKFRIKNLLAKRAAGATGPAGSAGMSQVERAIRIL
jgi:hypothetical protein